MSYPAYPSYQNSEIKWLGQLPDHWSVTALKRNFQICGGSTPDPDPKNWDGEISWYTPADLSGLETFQLGASKRTISKAGLFSSGCTLLPEGSIVISTRAPIGSLGITTTSGCTNQGCKGLIPASHISPVYYTYLLVTGKAELNSRGRGSTFTEISGEELGVIRVPVPPHAEQNQIARFLDHQTARIDALIAEQQRLIELLKEKRQAVISHAVTKGVDPDVAMTDSGVEWLGEIPAHWAVTRVKRIFRMVVDPAPKNNDFELLSIYTDIGVKPRKDLEEKGNKASTTDGYLKVQKGDLIVNKLLAWMGAVGHSDYEGVTSPAYDILRSESKINPKFFHYLFRSKITQQEFKRWSRGIMEMRLRLYFDDLGRIKVPCPPYREQSEIVKRIERLERDYESLSKAAFEQIDLLKERRSALISAAVTGKIDVRDWEPPVSETFPQSTASEEAPA